VSITWTAPSEGGTWYYGFDEKGEQIFLVSGVGELLYDGEKRKFNSKTAAFAEAERIYKEHLKGASKMGDILKDMKGFMHENRNVLYWLALAFLADHFFFNGAFRARLNAVVEGMIGRAEKQLAGK
jgi:hypothetical protein